ncbi:hypothetical protein [Pseudomonas sp. MPB23]|uniref:hypothetical protein n=1 Tax=Pseudomonas sp. MPB23 TaxID=3388490 RepID=UPI003984CB83
MPDLFFTAFQLANNERGRLLPLNMDGWESVATKLLLTMDKVMLLFNPALWGGASIVLVAAGLSYLRWMRHFKAMTGGAMGRTVVVGVYLLAVPILLLCVPGAMLFVVEKNLDARNYVGFSVLLVFLFLLSYELFSTVWKKMVCFLVVPTMIMFSLSYTYGQVLVAKKELEIAMATYMAYDLISRSELNTKRVFYYRSHGVSTNWIPSAHGAMTHMPVQRYILSGSNAMLFPEFFPRLGITNVVNGYFYGFQSEVAALKKAVCEPVVDNPFYSICVVGDSGFIAIKNRADSEDYTERFKP